MTNDIDEKLLAQQAKQDQEEVLSLGPFTYEALDNDKALDNDNNLNESNNESPTPEADQEVRHYLTNDIIDEEYREREDDGDDTRSDAEILLALVESINILFFKDQYKIPHASMILGEEANAHTEIMRIESKAFKRYLVKLYYDQTRRIIGSEAVKSVVQILQARAEYDGETFPLSLRVAWHNDEIYYDMTNDKWQCVKISKDGWQILQKTPHPLFTRYSQISQTDPSKEYDADVLDQFFKLTNLKSKGNKDSRLLLQVYIISLFIPDIPHAMLVLHGEKGSAKSTLQTLIKMLVDPAKPRLLTIYNDVKEFIQQLAHNHVAYYDNLKHTPRWLSDEACKAVTGVGSTKRKLYSDDDDIVYEYKRCLGFNGINIALTEPDALDRSILIELERIKRKETLQETEIMNTFYNLRPRLLGYIFDTIAKAIAIKPTIKLDSLPRMADFAIWGEAIARAIGYPENGFINAYYDNIGKQNTEAIESSPLGQAIEIFWKSVYNEETPSSWQGLTSEALEELNSIAIRNQIHTDHDSWPQSADSLTKKLKIISSNLREGLGIYVTVSKVKSGKMRGRSILRVSQNALHAYTPYQTTFEDDFASLQQGTEEQESRYIEQTEANAV